MDQFAYVNGDYVAVADAKVSVFDRGFLFADGIYEVVKALNGRPCDLERHLDRMQRSLAALAIPPDGRSHWLLILGTAVYLVGAIVVRVLHTPPYPQHHPVTDDRIEANGRQS